MRISTASKLLGEKSHVAEEIHVSDSKEQNEMQRASSDYKTFPFESSASSVAQRTPKTRRRSPVASILESLSLSLSLSLLIVMTDDSTTFREKQI